MNQGKAVYSEVDECDSNMQAFERAVVWSEKERCSSKMKPGFRAEWEMSSEELFFESDEQEFNLRGVKSKKISSHLGRDVLKSVLKVRND